MSGHPTLPAIEFRIPFVPGSKKNNYRPRKQHMVPFREGNGKYRGRPVYSGLRHQEGALRAFLCAEMSRRGLTPFPKDVEVSVEITVHRGKADEDNFVMLYAFPLGKRRMSGRKGSESDLDGVLTTILDAMQGAVFENDRQVTKLHAVRRVDDEPAEPWMPTASEVRA